MRGTARRYGLKIDYWVDERRDPIKSTVAAANLLKDLYEEFGDWYLAMAAYNAGSGKIRKATRMTGSRDFWAIANTQYIRSETKHYVPKLLAALILASNPKANGFDCIPDNAYILPTSTVLVKKPLSLSQISKHLGISVETLKTWNPEMLRTITPPVKGGYPLRISPNFLSKYDEVEAELYDSAVKTKDVVLHQIKRGESLFAIARRYKVGVKEIQAFNPQLRPSGLQIGKEIAIPQ